MVRLSVMKPMDEKKSLSYPLDEDLLGDIRVYLEGFGDILGAGAKIGAAFI